MSRRLRDGDLLKPANLQPVYTVTNGDGYDHILDSHGLVLCGLRDSLSDPRPYTPGETYVFCPTCLIRHVRGDGWHTQRGPHYYTPAQAFAVRRGYWAGTNLVELARMCGLSLPGVLYLARWPDKPPRRCGYKRLSVRTTCRRGHPLEGDNLYISPGESKRYCRACRDLNRKRRAKTSEKPETKRKEETS